ncbi:MAG TPA: biotin/lipoyl-containing protein [Bryobacteraceae bacterium]|nr:biotin/lipoyl-containing protein [Bryobacteraceae bacterium]
MKWQILVNDRPVEIDPEQTGAARQVEPGVYAVLLDGRSFEVRILPGAQQLEIDGRRFTVEVRDPRDTSRRSRAALGGGRQNVTAPMPGKVIRVLVHEGDAVETGRGLVVVEAMKMQNEMRASRPGKVVEVRVQDGDTVGAGDTLVVLE